MTPSDSLFSPPQPRVAMTADGISATRSASPTIAEVASSLGAFAAQCASRFGNKVHQRRATFFAAQIQHWQALAEAIKLSQ